MTDTLSPDRDAKIRDIIAPWNESRCRVCGWTLSASEDLGCVPGNCSTRLEERWTSRPRADEPAAYSTDPVAFDSLMQEIGRRGLGGAYLSALSETVFNYDATEWGADEVWAMWCAPQSIRAAAALAVLTEGTT